jgi:hypothetical protein
LGERPSSARSPVRGGRRSPRTADEPESEGDRESGVVEISRDPEGELPFPLVTRAATVAPAFPAPTPRAESGSGDSLEGLPFFGASPPVADDDDDLWPIDPAVLEAWVQRRGRRRAVKAVGWLGLLATIGGIAFLAQTTTARDAMASWATMGQVESPRASILRELLREDLSFSQR